MNAVATFVTSRRGKWIVLAIWIVATLALFPLGSKLTDETEDDTTSFLPASAESTEVVKLLDDEFESGETAQGLIIYHRDGGLTDAGRDLKRHIEDTTDRLALAALDTLSDDEVDKLFRALTPITRKVVAAGDVPAATPMGLGRDDLDDDSAHLS